MAISSIAYGAIGLSIIYLFAAVVVSHVQEWISQVLQKRAKLLQTAIKDLVRINIAQDGAAKIPDQAKGTEIDVAQLADAVYNHGLVNGLLPGASLPAYVPAKNFAMAFLHRFGEQLDALKSDANNKSLSLKDQVDLLPNDSALKATLQALVMQANGRLDAFRDLLEKHYDNVMDRVAGMYKQWSRKISLVVALGVAVLLNLDTVAVFRAIDTDVRLQGAVMKATEVLQASPGVSQGENQKKNSDGGPTVTDKLFATVVSAIKPLVEARLPIGWTGTEPADHCMIGFTPIISIDTSKVGEATDVEYRAKCLSFGNLGELFYKVMGWLITAVAASLGAPFWFRIFENTIRLTGLKPAHDEDEPKQDGVSQNVASTKD